MARRSELRPACEAIGCLLDQGTKGRFACCAFSARGSRSSGARACMQVKEALMTSALLKLPQSLSRAKKEERVEQILTELVRLCSHPR